jgi:hypothetical protein
MKKNISTRVAQTATAVDAPPAPPQRADAGAAVIAPRYHAVVGLDVGDRQSHYCVLDLDGNVVTEGQVKTTEASIPGCDRRSWGLPKRATR